MTLEDKLNCKHRKKDELGIAIFPICMDKEINGKNLYIHNGCYHQIRIGETTYCTYETEAKKK